MSSNNAIVKSVAKELKYYCDVKRLEDGFDLSGINGYRLDNNNLLRLFPILSYDGGHTRFLRHFFSGNESTDSINMTSTLDSNGPKEERVKRKIKKHMTNYHFLLTDPALPQLNKRSKSKAKKGPKIPEYYYIYTAKPQVLPRSSTSIGISSRSEKRRSVKSTRSLSRSTPSDAMTKKDTDRLVNAAAKLLVATETVESIDSARSPRPQTAPRSFEENQRPHTAKYSYDINGRKIFNTQLTYIDSNSNGKVKRRSQSARSPVNRPGSPTPSHTSDDTYSSSISVDDVQRLKTPAPRPPKSASKSRNRTYISDNKRHDQEEVAVSKTIQTQDNDTVGIQTEKRLLEKYDHMEDEVEQGPWAEYQILVQTGSTNGASTKADVRITLYGEKGRSKEFTLKDSKNHKIKFQKGKEDCFLVAAHHVGKLKKIKIGHDRPELSYAWFLDNVTVSDMLDKRIYYIPCSQWVSGQNGDKETYLYLSVKSDRAFVESLETSCESTKPREKSKPVDVSRSPAKQPKPYNNNNKQRKRSVTESDSSEFTTSVEVEKKDRIESEKNKRNRDGSESESSYTSGSYTDSETETESESEEETVISLKDSPKRNSNNKRKISNDSSNKANGPTFTFRSKDAEKKGETENLNTQMKPESRKSTKAKDESDDGERIDKDYLKGYKAGLEAAQQDNIKKREGKLKEEKKVLVKGQTIHEASWNGNIERIKELVDHFPELKESVDENGMVPLHKAVVNGQTGVTKWLAAASVNLNVETPTSYTPMHLAALHGHVNIMMILSAMGAAVSCETIEKQTPLHLAARGGHLECVKWLVANRASLTAEDNFERKPVDLAEEFEQDIVTDFLRACEKELNNPNSGFARMYGSTSPHDSPVRNDKTRDGSQKAEDGSDDDQSASSASSVGHDKNIEDRRKSYEEQHVKMTERGKSFLDTIRQDIEEDD